MWINYRPSILCMPTERALMARWRTRWPAGFAPLVRIVRDFEMVARIRCTTLGPGAAVFWSHWYVHPCRVATILATNRMVWWPRQRTHSLRHRACNDRAAVSLNLATHAAECRFYGAADKRRHPWLHGTVHVNSIATSRATQNENINYILLIWWSLGFRSSRNILQYLQVNHGVYTNELS